MPGIRSRRISCDAASAPRSSSSLLSSSSSSAAAAKAANDNYVTMYDRRNCIAMRRSVSATCRWILLLIFVGSIDAVLSSSGMTSSFHNFRFSVEPSDIVATVGQSAILDCGVSVRSDESDATSGSAVDVRWMKDDTLIVFDNRRNVLSNGSLYFSMVESSPSHRPDEGIYQCVATARGAGAIISRKARLRLSYVELVGSSNPLDQQLTPAARLELQPGDRLMLPCPVRGLPRPRTRWYRNDVELDAAALTTTGVSSSAARTTSRALIHEDGVLELGDLQPSDAGRYRCRLDAGNESKYSNVSTALVVDSGRQAAYKVHPQFIMKPRDTLATEGATVLLHCGANGRDRKLAAPRIDWLRDGSTIDVSNEPDRMSIVGAGSLRISPVLDQDSALYTCRASNMEESIDGDATLSVQVAPRIRVLPKDTAVPGNTDVELPCSASGVPAPSVTWVKDGDTVIPSDYFQLIDGGNLRILGVLASDAGMYQCIASNAVGNVQATAQLVVSSNDISSSASSSSSSSSYTVTSSQHPSGLPQGTTESPAVGVPSAPVDLLAAHVSVRFITLSWRPPAHSGLSDITGYTVYWKDATSDRERIMNTTDVEAHVQQLRPATRYEFRVVAWNSLGSSRQTATLAVETLPEALVPDAPVNVRVTSIQTSSVHLAWESPVNSNGPIVTYKVYYYSPEDDEGELDLNVDVAECVLSELGRFRQYVIRVVAFNANGPGIESEEITCRTLSDVPSLPPQNVSIEALSSSSVLVRWEPPPQSALNGIITGYKIRYRPRGDKNGDTITTDGSRRMYDITDLHRHTEYSVRIHAMTVNGSGPATQWLNVETFANDLDETDVPGPPTALDVRAQFNSIQVSWTAPAESHKMVRGYVLGYGIGIPDVFRQVLDAQLRSFHIKSLKPSSEYVISLKAFNNVGEGEPVYENVFTREETTPEPLTPMMPPVGVKAVVLSSTSVLLTWTDTSLGRNQHVTDSRYYVIRYNPKLFRKPRLVNTTELNFHLDDLRPDTEYEFSIKVVKGQRQSTWSLSVFNQTGQAAPTTAPRDLTVSLIDNRPHWASLSWQPPRQPNGQITGYLVFYSTDATLPDRDWAIEGVLGDRTTVTIRDLSTYSTYYFKIQARNSMGYGPLSPTVIFRTSAVGSDGSLYTDEESLKFGGVKDSSGSMPTYVLWIIIGSIGLVSVIATTVILVVVCRRRSTKKRQDDEAADADNDEPKTTIGALKPPDLWIHDQVERRTSSANSGTEAAPSVAGSQGFNDDSLSVDTVQEDERYRRMAIRPPLMIPIDHPPQPRDHGSPFGGLGVIRTGLYPRPTALQYTHSTPRVNAGDLCQPSLQADYALSTLDRHRKLRDMPPSKLGSNPRLAVQPQAQSYGNNRYQSSVPSSSSSSSSSSSKATPPPSTSLLMSATGKSKSQLPAIVGSRSPDVTLRSETSPQDIQKSVSTEELSAEMANLEGLMKDLNAITQHEFHC